MVQGRKSIIRWERRSRQNATTDGLPCPFRLLLSSFACLCIGYSAVRLFYNGTVSLPTDPATTFSPAVLALMFWEFVTGVGGNAGIAASLNGTAKSFPDHSVRSFSDRYLSSHLDAASGF